jgi:hypothetical protein
MVWGEIGQVHHVAHPMSSWGRWVGTQHLGMASSPCTSPKTRCQPQTPDLNYGTTRAIEGAAGGQRYVFMFGRAFGIASGSQHKAEAWEFLRFPGLPENQAAYATGGVASRPLRLRLFVRAG